MSTTVNSKSSTAGRPVFGTWTHTEGTANETLTVAGYVFGGNVVSVDSSGQVDVGIRWSVSRSTTTGISTITIHYSGTVSDGRFYFFTSAM